MTKKFDVSDPLDIPDQSLYQEKGSSLYGKSKHNAHFQYVKTKKSYNLHLQDKARNNLKESYSSLPLSSLIKVNILYNALIALFIKRVCF